MAEAEKQETQGPWIVVVEPDGRNPGKVEQNAVHPDAKFENGEADRNAGGMVVYVSNLTNNTREEVSRVAWVRRHSRNPSVSFRDQLHAELEKAEQSAATLNGYHANRGTLQ